MNFRRAFFTLSIGIFFLSFFSAPLKADISYDVSLSGRNVTLGETILVRVMASWPKAEGQYEVNLSPLNLRGFELVREGESQETFPRNGQEVTRKTFLFELKPLEAGTGYVAPMTLSYQELSKNLRGEYALEEVPIPILKPPFPYLFYAGVGTAALLFLGLLLFIRKLLARNKNSKTPTTTLEDETLENLERINAGDERPNYQKLLMEIDKEFLNYIHTHYEIGSEIKQKDQLSEHLKAKNISENEKYQLVKLLDEFERLKFRGEEIDRFKFNNLKRETTTFIKGKRVL